MGRGPGEVWGGPGLPSHRQTLRPLLHPGVDRQTSKRSGGGGVWAGGSRCVSLEVNTERFGSFTRKQRVESSARETSVAAPNCLKKPRG